LREEISKIKDYIPPEHRVGGHLFTHSHPNYKRILKEGLDSYEVRVRNMENAELREGLLDVIAGIRSFHGKVLQYMQQTAPESELLKALECVPFQPARTLYEAIVCENFIYYVDGCDNIGRPDDLMEYYNGEDATAWFRCFFENVDANDGWSGAVGPDYNPLTLQCIKAVKGLRRPSIELRVTPEMPQEVWDAAMESIYAGGGSPSLYNEYGYQKRLEELFPEIPKEDLLQFAGGGCTETMLAGLSNVGSLDAGINVALIFEKSMRAHLAKAADFESFYQAFIEDYAKEAQVVMQGICLEQKRRALYKPQPLRTLLIDDCIEREKEYNKGGARYHWSVINLSGMINVLDSLMVINKLVFTDKIMSGAQMLEALDRGENFLHYKNVERHGNDSEEANACAHRLSGDLCEPFEGKTTYLGGKFMASSIQFVTYLAAGACVPATPDGRDAGGPLCDSIGAIHNNDKKGITALLNSAASLCQEKLIGTPVMNIKLDKNQVSKTLKPLVNGYFKKGGLQLQVTCINEAELLDAKAHPEKYPNLVVRMGGYSEYFKNLSPDLQQTVIDRTLYGI